MKYNTKVKDSNTSHTSGSCTSTEHYVNVNTELRKMLRSGNYTEHGEIFLWVFLAFLIFFFFLWPHLQHMEVPRLRTELELQLRPTPQPQQHQIQATTANYTIA